MKHQHSGEVKVDLPTNDLEQVIDKIVDGAVTIIVVATAAHILRRWLV